MRDFLNLNQPQIGLRDPWTVVVEFITVNLE